MEALDTIHPNEKLALLEEKPETEALGGENN